MSRAEERELNIGRVIKVAQALFLKNGIANTSINAIDTNKPNDSHRHLTG